MREMSSGATVAIVIVAALLAFIPAAIAAEKGRSRGTWWVYGFLLFVVALVHSILLKPSDELVRRKLADGGCARSTAPR